MAYYSADAEKHEHELYEHVRKAVLVEESAPKQKHVRAIAAYTWIHKNSVAIWNSFKMLNVLTNEVQSFKSLITIHSLLRDGHPNTLQEAMKQKSFLESFKNNFSQTHGLGYGGLLRNYVDFLYNKLALHVHHPKFTGNFGYKDVSVKEFDYKSVSSFETADLNEGFVTVEELMDLQDAVDAFQKSVFKNLVRGANNNCRISALVPFVEESYGLYLFLTNMLQSLHRDRAAWDALEPLRDRYRDQFWMLKHFYDEARKLPYLTSLIVVPRLPDKPPEFYIISERNRAESDRSSDIGGEPPRRVDEDGGSYPMMGASNGINPETLRLAENSLDEARQRNAELEAVLQQYSSRMRNMDTELDGLRRALQEGQFNWDRLRQLEEELRDLRAKYDKLAKAYAQLTAEHQELAREHAKCGELRSQLDLTKREMDNARRAKENELAAIARERDQLRVQMEAQKQQAERYRRDLDDGQRKMDSLARAKGDEVQDLMNTMNAQRIQVERSREALAGEVETLRAQLVEKDRSLKYLETDQLAVMDAGLEESARRIKQMEQQMLDEKEQYSRSLKSLSLQHNSELDKVMGNVMEACRIKVQDALSSLDDPMVAGNTLATPEVALTTGERLLSIGSDFTDAFLAFLKASTQGGANNASNSDAMLEAQALAAAMEQLLMDAKGTARLTDNDALMESITAAARMAGKAACNYFSVATPATLRSLDVAKVNTMIMDCNDRMQSKVQATMKSVEQLLSEENARTARLEGDLADIVEKEMMGAAKAIDEATRRLMEIMAKQQQQASSLTGGDATQISVHASLLDAAMAMTKAIGNLVKAATSTQQEIVMSGKGGNTATQFYKQHHRWTEGLISAAKMVAAATMVLVEVADGVVGGTRTMEDLIAASKEVSAATAQLVAAARVKMVRGSRTQEPLENASRLIGEAVRNLVNAADKAIKQRQQQQKSIVDLSSLSLHEMKIRELEIQSKILTLERQTAEERRRLAEMRRSTYQTTA